MDCSEDFRPSGSAMNNTKSLHVFIEGTVQGVGFRWFAEREANRLGLTGYVCNLADGRVEAYAEGETATLKIFLEKLRAGPRVGYVTRAQETWGESTGQHSSFQITF